MRYLNLFAAIIFPFILNGQPPQLQWSGSIGGPAGETHGGMSRDQDGNLFVTGTSQGTADFDPGPAVQAITATGVYEIFILKLDPAGDFLWVKSIPCNDFIFPHEIAPDPEGNVYIFGAYNALPPSGY